MWWENLSYLDELCRSGTMSAAARGLRVDKATVSRRLAELARSAPAPLFERHNGQVVLTPYGTRALDAFRDHVRSRKQLDAELSQADDDSQGSVVVSMPAFFASEIVARALPSLREAEPEIDVALSCSNRLLDVARGEADIALRNVRPNAGNLTVRRIGQMRIAQYASHAYVARRGDLRAARCLSGHDLLSYHPGPQHGPGFEWLQAGAEGARVALTADELLPLRAAANAGLGLITLPAFLGEEAPELTRVAGGVEGVVDLWMVTRQNPSTRVQAVCRFLLELVQKEQPRLCPAS